MGINISCNVRAHTLGSLAKNLSKPRARSISRGIGKTFIGACSAPIISFYLEDDELAYLGGQQVLILKEGSSRSRGKDAQRSNMTAARIVAEVVKSTLGPRGMDKMLVDSLGDVTVTNDGATVLDEIDVQNPAAKMMVEVSKTTDDEVGD